MIIIVEIETAVTTFNRNSDTRKSLRWVVPTFTYIELLFKMQAISKNQNWYLTNLLECYVLVKTYALNMLDFFFLAFLNAAKCQKNQTTLQKILLLKYTPVGITEKKRPIVKIVILEILIVEDSLKMKIPHLSLLFTLEKC